jgi:hypothetical protein
MPDETCEECDLKPWDADDLTPGDMVCVCDDINELDPAYLIGHFMPIAVGGDYCPGPVDGNPLFVAVWLEYGRRGGVESAVLAEYRSWLAGVVTPSQLERIMRICAVLEVLTEAGNTDGLCAYLDTLMAVPS